jgi:hypothetical protein
MPSLLFAICYGNVAPLGTVVKATPSGSLPTTSIR